MELILDFGMGYRAVVDALPIVKNGQISLPDTPGLGIALLPELFTRDDAIHRRSNADGEL